METITITKEAKKGLIEMFNKSLEFEYGFILNYPRIIENMENMENIHDEQLNQDLQRLGMESIRHFNDLDNMIVKLGGEARWNFGVIERLDDVQEILIKQLGKEKGAMYLFEQARKLVQGSKIKVKVGTFFNRLVKNTDGLIEDIVTVNEIMIILEREIADEKRHIRICEDSVATLKALKGKET